MAYFNLVMHSLGWGSCALGCWSGVHNAWQVSKWERGYGKVIGYETRPNGEDDSYHPKIKISGLAANAEFVSDLGGPQKYYKIGARVPIIYRRTKKRTQGEVFSWSNMIVPPVFLLILGVVFLRSHAPDFS